MCLAGGLVYLADMKQQKFIAGIWFISILIILTAVLPGCAGSPFTDNEQLLQRLIGRNESPRHDILYIYPDGTFTDTVLTEIPFSNGVYVPDYVITGRITLRERLLAFHDVKPEYMRRREIYPDSVSEYYIYPRVVIVDRENDILMQPVALYTAQDTIAPGLFKNWEGEFEVIRYDGGGTTLKSGTVREVYRLDKNTGMADYSRAAVQGDLPAMHLRDTVIYKHPYLWLAPGGGNLIRLSASGLTRFIKDPQLYLKPEELEGD